MGTRRNFFSNLSWQKIDHDLIFPIFSHEELSTAPIKWLKHLLLVRVGLRNLRELGREIHRFSMTQFSLREAENICETSLKKAKQDTLLIVIKVIFPNISMGLPNYRLTDPEQVRCTFLNLETTYMNKIDEFWLCESCVSSTGSNFGGRFSLRLDDKYIPDLIEIIWYTSPRLLDEYQSLNLPYIMALKNPGSSIFNISKLFIPANENKLDENELLNDFRTVLIELDRRKEQINILSDILLNGGARELALEFKMDSGRFKIIDWDTDAE